ncbi:MAG: lipoate--protein ligase [Spirochaetales bacterium]|nr:lipoate--protein ligase [Spirochaetales bacterium]
MKVYYSGTDDPFLNLSIEKWLLKREDLKETEILLFYRNRPSVILGRFQNPWLECDLEKMAAEAVPLVRRESGGGTVYHDMGNMNFSFIGPKENFAKRERTALIVQALRSLRIPAEQGERNDIYIAGRKISGSAGRYTSSRALLHGTLLISADLSALGRYLISKDYHSTDVSSQGIASIRADVTNICDYNAELDYETICEAIVRETSHYLQSNPEVLSLNESETEEIQEIENYRSAMTSWDWIYGKTPSFTMVCPVQASRDSYLCRFTVKKGLIEEISIAENTPDEEREALAASCSPGTRFSAVYSAPV